jgi:hypothetical protein
VRGQLLEILTQAPNLRERIAQGGAIGYTIITLGVRRRPARTLAPDRLWRASIAGDPSAAQEHGQYPRR